MLSADIQFGTDNGFDAILVGFAHKLKRSHHVSMIGYRQRIHAKISRLLGHLCHTAHRLENTEFGVRMEVNHRNRVRYSRPRFHTAWWFLCLLFRCLGRREVGGFQFWRFVLNAIRVTQFRSLNHPQAAQFEEAFGGGIHIVRGIVCFPKPLPKKLLVEFGQCRPLVLASSSTGNRAIVRGLIFGVNDRLVRQLLHGLLEAMVFRSNDVHIKLNVVPHDIGRTGEIRIKFSQRFCQRYAISLCARGRDPVNFR